MAKKGKQEGGTLDTARKVVGEVIDTAARLVGQAGEQAASLTNAALETASGAVASVSPTAGEVARARARNVCATVYLLSTFRNVTIFRPPLGVDGPVGTRAERSRPAPPIQAAAAVPAPGARR